MDLTVFDETISSIEHQSESILSLLDKMNSTLDGMMKYVDDGINYHLYKDKVATGVLPTSFEYDLSVYTGYLNELLEKIQKIYDDFKICDQKFKNIDLSFIDKKNLNHIKFLNRPELLRVDFQAIYRKETILNRKIRLFVDRLLSHECVISTNPINVKSEINIIKEKHEQIFLFSQRAYDDILHHLRGFDLLSDLLEELVNEYSNEG